MRFNRAELASLVENPETKFDKEGLLIITERQEGFFWRSDVNWPRWCKLHGNLLFYLKDNEPKSSVAGVLVLENCRPIIRSEERELDGFAFILDFEGSLPQRICTASSQERLDWVKCIQLASNTYLNKQIKYLEDQIAVATAAKTNKIADGGGSNRAMGNCIEPGATYKSSGHEAHLLNMAPLGSALLSALDSSVASGQQQQTSFEEDLTELPICESAICCDNLPLNAQGGAPNPRVICTVLQPGEDCLWREHARTEMVESTQAPHFLCTMRFLRSAGFGPDTLLRFTVYDVRERVSLTAVPMGHADVALGVIQDATRFRIPLRSLGGEYGFITLASWTPDRLSGAGVVAGVGVCGPSPSQAAAKEQQSPQSSQQSQQSPRSKSTQFFGTSTAPCERSHRRSQSLPSRLGVRLFMPQQCSLQRVCVHPRVHTYRLHSSLGADISVQEVLLESRLCFAVPQQLLSIWILREKELLQEISGMGELDEDWRWRQINLLEEHLRLLKEYSQAKQNIQQMAREAGPLFKRSSMKTDEAYEFLPVNLHLQRMCAQNDSLQRTGMLDIITVGAFTRHDPKSQKCGGLIRLLQESKAWKLEQSNACKVQSANDAVQATKQLRKEIVELMSQLLHLAKTKTTKGMMLMCNKLVVKTKTLLNIWEPNIAAEAMSFIEKHRIVEMIDTMPMEPLSPFRKITQQLTALELKSPELEDFATPVIAPPDLWPRVHKASSSVHGSHTLTRSNSWHPSPSFTLMDIQTIDSLQQQMQCYNVHLRQQLHAEFQADAEAMHQSLPAQCQLDDAPSCVEAEPHQAQQTHDAGERNGQDTPPPSSAAAPSTNAGFLDTKIMSYSPSANYYTPTEEPEPLDITQLNIEASVMCLVSKIKFYCGRCDSPATRLRHPHVQLRREGFSKLMQYAASVQQPDVIAALDSQPLQTTQLNLDIATNEVEEQKQQQQKQNPVKKGNKFTAGLDLSQASDWANELRHPMRKLRQAMDRLLKTARLQHSVQRLHQDIRCIKLLSGITYRRDVCFSQALTTMVTALMVKLWGTEVNADYINVLSELGPLAYFEGLLSLHGAEADMWSDMCIAIEDLTEVNFILARTQLPSDSTPLPRIVGSRQALDVLLPAPDYLFSSGMVTSEQPSLTFKITPVFFNIGINEKATLAETLGQTREQHRSNWDNFLRLRQYFNRYRKLPLLAPDTCASHSPQDTHESLKSTLNLMEDQLRANVSKNVKILHLAEDACRLMSGLRFTSCKSAKDRTGMAVTLEQCRVLAREFQLPTKDVPTTLGTMRSEGARMDNVYKNIGKPKYAFNLPQVLSLPAMYRPPVGTYGKAET